MILRTVPLLLATALTVFGCSVPFTGDTDVQAPAPSTSAPATPSAQDLGPTLQAMSPDDKRAALGADFPVELPVPGGAFNRARAQGTDAWDYELVVATTPEAAAQWYVDSYGIKDWVVTGTGALDGGGYFVTMQKNAAQVRFDIRPGSAKNEAVVTGILGVGAQVLETQ